MSRFREKYRSIFVELDSLENLTCVTRFFSFLSLVCREPKSLMTTVLQKLSINFPLTEQIFWQCIFLFFFKFLKTENMKWNLSDISPTNFLYYIFKSLELMRTTKICLCLSLRNDVQIWNIFHLTPWIQIASNEYTYMILFLFI
jgi:hypothetical protein